jgi:hypothetical protein
MRKKCTVCDIQYSAKSNRSKYCSGTCKKRAYRESKRITIEKECLECGKNFSTTKSNKIHCSTKCRRKKQSKVYRKKHYEPAKYSKVCLTCNTHFEANRKDHMYCKKSCQPSSKQSRKLRKRTKRKCKLSVESWSDIEAFLLDRPDGCDLDHIIPLNHPDVCGLHNTWNFQWLSKDDNNLKSNKFDSTMDNNTWKSEE